MSRYDILCRALWRIVIRMEMSRRNRTAGRKMSPHETECHARSASVRTGILPDSGFDRADDRRRREDRMDSNVKGTMNEQEYGSARRKSGRDYDLPPFDMTFRVAYHGVC